MSKKHRRTSPSEPSRFYHGADVPISAIRRYARQIAERFQPDKIILFGSHAYGQPHEDSDVDLLVIMPARNQLDQAFKIRWQLPAPFAMDLIVRTPKEMKWRLEEGESFLTEITSKGKILYEKDDTGARNRRKPTKPAGREQTLPSPRRRPITKIVAPAVERGTPSEDNYMKIHEYQAKELLARAGAAIPRGVVASSAAEAQQAFDQLGGPVVVKAQVHAGGRGKGHFKDSGKDFGGVKFVTNRADAGSVAEVMLKYPLVTRQTGEAGQKVSKLLVVEASAKIVREVYVGMVLDRALGAPVLMACAEGGVEIEEVAARSPEKILKTVVEPEFGLQPFQARRVAYDLGFTGEQAAKVEAILLALAKVYLEKDCSLAEINPLAVMDNGDVLAVDAKITFDDNALFRHPDLAQLRDETEEDPAELRAGRAGLSYISLTGNIGCLVNGAGLAMATMDIIKYHGGEPANFLDVGGGANKEQVTEAFRILLGDPRVKAVLVNIFGGIMQCDIIAGAILAAFKEVGFHVPLVVRLEGTNVELGRKMLAESGLNIATASGLTEAAKKVVAAAK